ncbi:hypothetical protein MIR68_001732 [Amoeboaphelidium protococcarum]|nr:hypothetical protein MIR68_001732 [Amoeboaphelidium protococcarum]
MIRWYQRVLQQYPYTTQMATAGVLFATGDVMAQKVYNPLLLGKPEQKYDYIRTLRMTAYGFFVAGPATFAWYRWLDRNVVMAGRNQSLVTATRVALDQFAFAPCFLYIFFNYMAFTDKSAYKTSDAASKAVSEQYPKALLANYQIWPFVQLINFYFVPLNYRLLLVNTVAIGWNGYLSLVASKHVKDD